ncbi:hypothetical protein GCM10020001_028240 [Nonomuraea salmonea]
MITPGVGTATVPKGVRFGYGIGSFCTSTVNAVPGLLLLFYMTNFLAVPAWLAGVVVTAPKIWDLIINPLVGRWSDRTVSRWGAAPALAARRGVHAAGRLLPGVRRAAADRGARRAVRRRLLHGHGDRVRAVRGAVQGDAQ